MKVDKFQTFLKESGAEVLAPTNPYEMVRFKTENGVSVMYRGRRGITFTGEAQEAYEKFQRKSIWQIKGNAQKARERIKAEILERDGVDCFFCGKPTLDGQDRTIEHLLSIDHGGNNNLANLVFAHKDCNLAVGNMPIIEKIKYRDTIRGG